MDTPLEVDTKIANALLGLATEAFVAAQLASRDASITALQGAKADATLLASYATNAALSASETTLQSALDAIFAELAALQLSGSGGVVNAPAWAGFTTIQGPNTRFPLSGSSKRQGCVSHSTPEAEIVAADVAMRSMGMPALKLVERILKKSPNFVFYDDNKAMIGVVRSGRNPTMRHLERSHGVSISWMHEMFTRDYMYLAYEVTDRMAADIYTKAFNDGRKWKHACLQIGLLDPSLLSDPDTLKALTPTCDPIKGTMQTASGTVDGVPTFPYTHIPIMPPDLWWSGLTSKEGLHEHEGMIRLLLPRDPD